MSPAPDHRMSRLFYRVAIERDREKRERQRTYVSLASKRKRQSIFHECWVSRVRTLFLFFSSHLTHTSLARLYIAYDRAHLHAIDRHLAIARGYDHS